MFRLNFVRAAELLSVASLLVLAPAALAAPKVLQKESIRSPDKRFMANVESDDVGFMGVIRMRIYHPNGDMAFSVELPQINPEPANLAWIDEDWVACESFLGDRASAFFFVHVPTKRGYMIEIFAPRPDADWMLNYVTNDSVSTAAIHTISRNRSSLFPVLMRDLPTDGPDYYTTEFCEELRDALHAYSDYRKKEKIRNIEFLTTADHRTSVGAVLLATVDQNPEVVYFPMGTTTTVDLLGRTKRQGVSDELRELATGLGAPSFRVMWTDDAGSFEVQHLRDDGSTSGTVMRGKFEGAVDSEFIPDENEPLAADAQERVEEPKPEKTIPAAKGKSSSSKSSASKKPSRSR